MKLRNAKRMGYHFCANLGVHVHPHSLTHARISGVHECGIVCETEIVEKQQKQL